MPPSEREAEVWRALAEVADPELDESVVALDFITAVAVDGGDVSVRFRLPTFWCSANFAFIMAEDMAAALGALSWVATTDIRLVDHFAAAKINAGIAGGEGFSGTFGAEAGGDLATLRETFRRKAYLGRMSRLIDALKQAGWGEAEILGLRVADLRRLQQAPALAARFLALREVYGGPGAPDDPAFRTVEGDDVTASGLAAFLRDIRMTRRGVEANGEMCRILLAGRKNAVPA